MVKRTPPVVLAAMLLAGCWEGARPAAPHPRIVSYSPAVTDILYDLGLGEHVVGVTNWCILPAGQKKPRLGGQGAPNSEAILPLEPDLIFIQEDPAKFAALLHRRPGLRVINVHTDSVEGIVQAVRTVAAAAGVEQRGGELADKMAARLDEVRRRHAGRARPRVLFAMGYDHPGTAGAGTYVDEVITIAGGVNVAAEKYRGWPIINMEMALLLRPDVVICQANEGDAPAARRYWQGMNDLPAVKTGRIHISTDRRLTFPGSRVVEAAEQFAEWIHAPGGSGGGGGP